VAERYDVVVVGVGGMGSAALYHLARRGKRVLGIERFDIPNELGSSHGVTRIIRQAYFEHPSYVPLVRRAYELWRELEAEGGEQLLFITGAVEGGPRIFEGAVRSSVEHALPFEELDGAEVTRRFPAFRLPPDLQVVYQQDGGFLLAERCILAHVAGARARGAEVWTGERVLEWSAGENGVRVRTDRRGVEAERLVLAAGAYSQDVARLAPGMVVAQRQVLGWLEPTRPELFAADRFPVFNLALEEGHVYGFPIHGVTNAAVKRTPPGILASQGCSCDRNPRERIPILHTTPESARADSDLAHQKGFKIGFYDHEGTRGDPEAISRQVTTEDEVPLRRFAERYFPDGAGRVLDLKACLFELSPDEHFLIDRHPETDLAVLGAGFSGHGFKFCSVVGEILADLALDGETLHDIEFLRLSRFA
jgi:sarcosine oxidase